MEAGDPAELPIVYMPGVGKEALKEPANLANELAPLGPLLFRSLWFTHINGKDWTIRSLLSNTEKGLGLSVGSDNATAEVLPAALPTLLRQMMHRITGRMIDVNFVNDLLVPDHARSCFVGSILHNNKKRHRRPNGQPSATNA